MKQKPTQHSSSHTLIKEHLEAQYIAPIPPPTENILSGLKNGQ